jgi:endonuclease G
MGNKTTRTALISALLMALIVFFIMKSRENVGQPPLNIPVTTNATTETGSSDVPADPSFHLVMGNPSKATDDPTNTDNFLMRKTYFALSYNDAKATPNWVSWSLKEGDFGTAARAQFYPDAFLPKSFRHVTPKDYTGSGFDRGHMCPRSDRTSTAEAATATFIMTNIVPQSPHVNQKAWNDLEEYCRTLVRTKKQTLYIVSGPQGRGGEGSKGPAESIASGRINVPAKCWKVVLVIDNGTGTADDITRVNSRTRAIAVIMPNDQSVGNGWAKYRTSVHEVEKLTGYKFFDRVPADIIGPIKQKVDEERIPTVNHTPVDD